MLFLQILEKDDNTQQKQNCYNNSLIGYHSCKDLKLHGHAVDAITFTEVLFCIKLPSKYQQID